MDIVRATEKDLGTIAAIADEVWRERYAPILSAGQIDYMLVKYQSVCALREQTEKQGYEYYLLNEDGKAVGYLGIVKEDERIFLSKLYVLGQYRGRGYTRDVLRFIYENAEGRKKAYLTVNKHNPSLEIYLKVGFKIADSAVADIGNGYVMDDYIMEYDLSDPL